MKRQLAILGAGLLFLSFTTDKPAYRINNAKGKDVPYSRMLKSLHEADIILFGEHHDNPILHWLQRELTGDLHTNRRDALVLGAEMFETDNQLLLDEYLVGMITVAKFQDEAKLWNNYKTDYKPLLKFAFDHEIPFVATNVPRRYANLVYREGFGGLEGLSPQAKKFLHFNGSGHSDNYEGIVWYLRQDQPDLKIMTITTVLQKSPEELMEALAEVETGSADCFFNHGYDRAEGF